MKKPLGIVVLGLLFMNVSFSAIAKPDKYLTFKVSKGYQHKWRVAFLNKFWKEYMKLADYIPMYGSKVRS